MGDALLATCLAAGLLLLAILLLLCLKGRNRNQDSPDYTIPRRPTAQPNHYMQLRTLTPPSQSTAQESPPDVAVPSYENSPASATAVEEGRQPSGNTGHPGNGVNNLPTGRQGTGSIRRQLAIEIESDIAGGGGPESSVQDEAGAPVVPPRRGVGEHASGGGAEIQPTGVSDVTSSREHDPDDASQSAMAPPQVPPRENGRVLRRQEAISDSASVPGSSEDSSDNNDGAADDASEDRLQHPNGDFSGDHGNHTAGRSGGRFHCNPGNGRDSPAQRLRDDLETVTVTPEGVQIGAQVPRVAGANHTFPRLAGSRGTPEVASNGRSRTVPRDALDHLETVIVHGDSVQVLTSDPSESGGANASPATQHSDRNDNSDAPPPVPRRPRQEGVGVVRLRK